MPIGRMVKKQVHNTYNPLNDAESTALPIKLILCARTPAPKPLSMFMTAMPEAQEFSMVRSGASPWNRAVAHARRHGDDRLIHQPAERPRGGRRPCRDYDD